MSASRINQGHSRQSIAHTFKHYIFLTSNFTLAAKVIADLYKARWQIEVFFEKIKQFLKIKKFVGTTFPWLQGQWTGSMGTGFSGEIARKP